MHMSLFHNLFYVSPTEKKRFNREKEEEERQKVRICRTYLREKQRKENEGLRGVDGDVALIMHRSGHYQPTERLYKTKTNGDHQSVHQ